MDFFKINSKSIAPPKDISFSFESLDKAERTMDGTMVVDVIGKKRKVEVTWDYLSKLDMKTLVTEARASAFVSISFNDSQTGELVTMVARTQEISYSPYYDWSHSELMWKSVSASFVER